MDTEYQEIEKEVVTLWNKLRDTCTKEEIEDIFELVDLEIRLSKWETD